MEYLSSEQKKRKKKNATLSRRRERKKNTNGKINGKKSCSRNKFINEKEDGKNRHVGYDSLVREREKKIAAKSRKKEGVQGSERKLSKVLPSYTYC